MLPVNSGGHSAYQDFVAENLRKYYPDPNVIPRSTWEIIERFWHLDLSYTDELLQSKYSIFGPKPRTPFCMQRSYLLSIDFKVDSITDWAAQLKINPLYAILSGFEFGYTPGIGTFYDFFNRLWNSGDDNLSPHEHPLKKKKVKKPKTKGTKADSIEKVTVAELLPQLEKTHFSLDDQPYAFLSMPYYQYFKRENITPFIDLNDKGGRSPVYKNDFTIDKDGVPICPAGCRMRRDGIEVAKGRMKFKCPKMYRKNGCLSCTCETPCSDAKDGRFI